MLSFDEALATVLTRTSVLGPCRGLLKELLGCYLAEDVIAPFDVPRFASTSVDGYAVQVADLADASENNPVRLPIGGEIRAGDTARLHSVPGFAVRVSTGSALPVHTEAVVMKEQTQLQDGHVAFCCTATAGDNIRPQGAEFRKGQAVLTAGTRVTPPVVGLLASLGLASAMVRERPRVALITTGNELVPPGTPLDDSQIYDSNSFSLMAALSLMPTKMVQVTRVPEDRSATQRAVEQALTQSDLVITVGGASVGEGDFAKDAFTASGVQLHFTSVAVKPGKPTVFGTRARAGSPQLVFGLPGNPVSALVCFHQFVRTAIHKMLGATDISALRMTATLAANLKKMPGRLEFVRGQLDCRQGEWIVQPTSGQESHMQGGLAQTNVLILFPAEASELRAGHPVTVERLTW